MGFSIAALGTALGVAFNALNTGLSAKNTRDQKRMTNARYAGEQAHDRAMASRNALDTPSAQADLAEYDRQAADTIENADAKAKLLGLTNEYGQGVRQAEAEGRADLMTGIVKSFGDQEATYLDKEQESKNAQTDANLAFKQQQQEHLGTAIDNVNTAVTSMLSAPSTATPKKASPKQETAQAPIGVNHEQTHGINYEKPKGSMSDMQYTFNQSDAHKRLMNLIGGGRK